MPAESKAAKIVDPVAESIIIDSDDDKQIELDGPCTSTRLSLARPVAITRGGSQTAAASARKRTESATAAACANKRVRKEQKKQLGAGTTNLQVTIANDAVIMETAVAPDAIDFAGERTEPPRASCLPAASRAQGPRAQVGARAL